MKTTNTIPNTDILVWGLIFNEEKLLVSQAVAVSLLSNINCSTKQPVTHQLDYNWAFKKYTGKKHSGVITMKVWQKSVIKYMSRMSAKC